MSTVYLRLLALPLTIGLAAGAAVAQDDPFEIDDEKDQAADTSAPSGPGGEVTSSFSITAFFGTDADGKEVNPYKDGDSWADLDKAKGALTDDDALRMVEGSNEVTMQQERAAERLRAEKRARSEELRNERSGRVDKLEEFEERLNK